MVRNVWAAAYELIGVFRVARKDHAAINCSCWIRAGRPRHFRVPGCPAHLAAAASPGRAFPARATFVPAAFPVRVLYI